MAQDNRAGAPAVSDFGFGVLRGLALGLFLTRPPAGWSFDATPGGRVPWSELGVLVDRGLVTVDGAGCRLTPDGEQYLHARNQLTKSQVFDWIRSGPDFKLP